MRVRKGQHPSLDADGVSFQIGEVGRSHVDERHVDLLPAELFTRDDGAARKELQSHLRPARAEGVQDGGQFPAVGRGVRESNAQAPDLALGDEAGSVDATPKIGEKSLGLFEKRFPSLGEAHASLQSLEECASYLVFELSYLPRQSRLNDMQPLGGAPKMLFFAHGNEIAKCLSSTRTPIAGRYRSHAIKVLEGISCKRHPARNGCNGAP